MFIGLLQTDFAPGNMHIKIFGISFALMWMVLPYNLKFKIMTFCALITGLSLPAQERTLIA